MGWYVIAAGSRPANNHPTTAANAGMARRMTKRSSTGTLPSAEIPPFNEFPRNQPIIPM